MSLKSFHIFFVSASVLLSFGFAGWAVWTYLHTQQFGTLVLGVASAAVGAGLVVYGVKVLRSLRRM